MPSSSSYGSLFVVAVKDLKCTNVPSIGIFKRPGKCYLQLVLGAAKRTTSTLKGSAAEWSEAFHFDIQGPGELKIGLYIVSKIGNDVYVGGLKETLQFYVAEERKVHRALATYDTEGNLNMSASSIQFTVMIFPRPGQATSSIRSIRAPSTNRHLSTESSHRRRASNTTSSTLLSPINFSPMFHERSLSGSDGYNSTYTSSPSPITPVAISSESEPVGATQGYQTHPTIPYSPVRTMDVPGTMPATNGNIVPVINIRQPSLPAAVSKETTDMAVSEAFDSMQQMGHAPKVLHTSGNVDSANCRDSGHNGSDLSVWVSLLDKVQSFAKLMDAVAEVHPYAQLAWSVLSAAYKVLNAQNARDDSIDSLVGTMWDVYTTIHQSEPLNNLDTHTPILALMAKQTTECAYFIRDYAKKKRFLTRLMTHALSNTDTQIQKYQRKFADLRKALQEKAVIQTEITVLHTRADLERLSETVADIVIAINLDDMNYARGARYNPDKGCLSGTRKGLIDQILGWINDDTDDASQVLLLHGDSGTGKSAVANEIAKRFDALRRLGSSFCFDRSHQAERRPDNVFSTIARDLAESDHQRKARLHDAIRGRRSLRTTSSILEQFEIFILQPAVQLQSLTVGPILIVIDALDESGDLVARRDILSALADKAHELPSNFRILITTRGEDDIMISLSHLPHVLCIDMNELDVEPDISLFVEKELDDVTSISSDSEWRPWLVEESNGVFQWAFTACNFVKGGGDLVTDPQRKLNILASAPQGDIDSLDRLYLEVLKQTFKVRAADRMRRFKAVVGHTLAAQAPLSMASLKELHSQYGTAADVDEILRPLGVLFSGVASDTKPVHPLHESLRDFLTNEKRSGPFYVDVSLYRREIVIRSLMLMNNCLRFNICNLEQSFSANQDIQNFQERVKNNIQPHVSYACRFWPEQLSATIYDSQIAKLVGTFLTSKALFWLEVLSANREVNDAPSILLAVIQWSQDDTITALAKDLRQFVLTFGSVISQSIPHIYLSALPAAPQRSQIAEIYNPQYLPTRVTLCDAVSTWPSIQNTVVCDTGPVLCVALSRDGKHFASGSSNAVSVWDLTTGEIISGPLIHDDASAIISIAFSHSGRYIASGSEGGMISSWHIDSGRNTVCGRCHSDSITSMMYSQHFELLVSGSSDCTIRTWDALTLESISTFHGPKEGINCVSISPNSILLASGSDDKAVQIWDVQTSAKRMPFEGHIGPVTSVVFAPDNERIISGSSDCTVRMWNVSTGASLAVYKNLNTVLINSVALSPDGKLVVSGSSRPDVAVWRTQYPNVLPELLRGHRDSITSIAFAQGGSSEHFVSGSKDGTMNVWTTQGLTEEGTTVALARDGKSAWGCYHSTADGTTFNFHCLVTSVAYSPSRKRVATGSSDGAFRVWDAVSGKLLVGPIKADSYSVNSVCFSPNGKVIASGGDDGTLCLWESMTGKPASAPFKAHKKKLLSVSFSPDGVFLVSASRDHTIVVWGRSGNIIAGPLRGHSAEVNSVAFSSDGKRIVSGADDIYIWETHGGRVSGPFKGHVKQVLSVAFSHDDTRILSGGQDHTIRTWDAVTGENTATLTGHTKAVHSVQFVSSDMLILSGSADNTVRLWDVLQGQTISVFRSHTNSVSSVALAPNGTRFASGSDDGVMRVRDLWAGEWQAPSKGGNLSTRFNGISLLDNGWIADSRGILLLWLPPWARVGFWLTDRIIVVQGYGSLDLTHILRNDRWHTLCCRAAEAIVSS